MPYRRELGQHLRGPGTAAAHCHQPVKSQVDSSGAGHGWADDVAVLFLEHGLSIRDIARRLGISRRRARAALTARGVPVPPRGVGRARPDARLRDAPGLEEQLRRLYYDAGLTRSEVARRLGLSEGLVRSRLAEFGIRTRTRGGYNREDRTEVNVSQLVSLYRDRELTADQVAAELGLSRAVVLRAAHDHGVPVRAGATAPQAPAIELIDALYRDRLVSGTLARHDVRVVPTGGSLAERFPIPTALSDGLLRDLYDGSGVSMRHIELVTGQPAATVRRRLRDAGIAVRPPGGRCPFLRRWLQSN